MRFHIPFTFLRIERLKAKARLFHSFIRHKKDTKLEEHLKNSNIDLSREEYISIIIRSFIYNFVFLFVISTTGLWLARVKLFYLFGPLIGVAFSLFVLFSQRIYPRIYVTRRQKNIEKNLIPALEDILIQLNSGIPLFNVMTNISVADYDELSVEFKKAVRRINVGEEQTEVLEDLGKQNPSVFFRRTLWQISNGMKAGSDMGVVVRDSIKALNEEQLIQIQNYGNKLNPLIMFYMLISVIIPALSVTFLTILSSMLNIEKIMASLLFVTLFIFVVLIQIMFLGLIKSKRPSLL
jgi:pilus assembly protein TadC